jgi:arabinogalactan endo-1,4-beta-galactosidase
MKKLLNEAVSELMERANKGIKEMIHLIENDNENKYELLNKEINKINKLIKCAEFLKEHAEKVYPEDKRMIEKINKCIRDLDIKLAYLEIMGNVNY